MSDEIVDVDAEAVIVPEDEDRQTSQVSDAHNLLADLNLDQEQSATNIKRGDKFKWNTIKRLTFGNDFGLAIGMIDETSQVFAWGTNDNNVLALGDEVEEAVCPAPIPSFKGKKAFDISAGLAHAAVVLKSSDSAGGKVYTWGLGTLGRLGYVRDIQVGEPPDPYGEEAWYAAKPYKVRFDKADGKVKIARVCCGGHFTYFLTEHGQLYVCGWSQLGALGFGEDVECIWTPKLLPIIYANEEEFVTQVDCGIDHVICCCRSGRVYTWGDGRNGRLGQNDDRCRFEPTLLKNLSSETIMFVAAGANHTAAIDRSERLWIWGSGDSAKLGTEDTSDRLSPFLLTSIQRAMNVALGANHSLALTTDYRLFAWGTGPVVGSETLKPIQMRLNDPVICLASGLASAMVYNDIGDLLVWGRPPLGLLDETDQVKPTTVPEMRRRGMIRDLVENAVKHSNISDPLTKRAFAMTNPSKLVSPCDSIACGLNHTLVLTPLGQVWGWGDNSSGQLGLGENSPENVLEPARVLIPSTDLPIRSISCGSNHSLCVTATNNLWVFGAGESGQLCSGRSNEQRTPFKVASLQGRVLKAVAGPNYSALILAPRATGATVQATDEANELVGELWVCGNSDNGKLGIPVEPGANVLDLRRVRSVGTDIIKVACGESHMCCLSKVGDILVWGTGNNGRLGTGYQKNEAEPVQVHIKGHGRIVDIACGSAHSLALTSQGTLFAWGKNSCIGSVADLLVPTSFSIPLRGVMPGGEACVIKAIACGYRHSGILTKNGRLVLWGSNNYYQVSKHGGVSSPSKEDDSASVLTPTLLKDLQGVDTFALGFDYSCCATRKGHVHAWGSTAKGKLGVGEYSMSKMDVTNVAVCWDYERPIDEGQAAVNQSIRLKPNPDIAENVTVLDIMRDLEQFEKPSIVVLQTALKASYGAFSLERLLKFESDTQHMFGKLIDRIMKRYEKEHKMDGSAADTLSSRYSTAKIENRLMLQKTALALGVSPKHLPSVFDHSITYDMPNGVQSAIGSHVLYLRENTIQHIQSIVESLILQPSYWIILLPFIQSHDHKQAFASLLNQIFHDLTDPHSECTVMAILRAIGRREILDKKSLKKIFTSLDDSLYLYLVNYLVFHGIDWYQLATAPWLELHLEDNEHVQSLVDIMETMGTGSSPVELCFLAKTEEDYEYLVKQFVAENPTNPIVGVASEILKSKVTIRKQFEDTLTLLEPLAEHAAQCCIIGRNMIDLWRSFVRLMQEEQMISFQAETIEVWAPCIRTLILSLLLPLLSDPDAHVERLGYPPLPKRISNNLRILKDVLLEGVSKQFSNAYNVKAYVVFEKVLSNNLQDAHDYRSTTKPGDQRPSVVAVSTNVYDIRNGVYSVNSIQDVDVRLVISYFLTHLRAFRYDYVPVRLEWWSLFVLINLFRESEPRLKSLSSFDPLLQAVRALCPSNNALPFPSDVIQDFKTESIPEEFRTECFRFSPAFLFKTRSMSFDQTSGCPVPQYLSFRQQVQTRKGAAVSSVVKPYVLPEEFDPRDKICKALLLAPMEIQAVDFDQLSDAFVSAHDMALRTGMGSDAVALFEECVSLCDTVRKSYTIPEICKYGIRILNEKRLYQNYLTSLKGAADFLDRLITEEFELSESRKVKILESTAAMRELEVDAALASIIESLQVQPAIWYGLANMKAQPDLVEGSPDQMQYAIRISSLLAHRIVEANELSINSAGKNLTFMKSTKEFSGSWTVHFGQLTTTIPPDS